MKSKPSPVKGQKLYRFWGKLETGTFIEESIAEGASAPTWLVRNDTRRIRCAVGSWFLTEKEALQDELDAVKSSTKFQRESIAIAKQQIAENRENAKQLRARIAKL